MTNTLLRINDVMAATGLRRATIYKYQRSGEFPQSVSIAKRAVAWRSTEIAQWIDSRIQSQQK